MQTCEICNYTLSIGKISTSDMHNELTDVIKFINIFKNNLNSDTNIIFNLLFDKKELNDIITKQNIDKEMSTLLMNKYDSIKKYSKINMFCLKCTQCSEIFTLTQRTLLSTKLKKTSKKINLINTSEVITDYTLPRTKDFICPNKECKTDPILKEAVIYKPILNEHITYYICVNCETVF